MASLTPVGQNSSPLFPPASPPLPTTVFGRVWTALGQFTGRLPFFWPTPGETPEALSTPSTPSIIQSIADGVFTAGNKAAGFTSAVTSIVENPESQHYGFYFLGKNQTQVVLDFDCFTPTRNLLEQLCPSNDLPKLVDLRANVAKPALAQAEKQLLASLSHMLTHITAIQSVNNIIGPHALSLEDTKKFIRTKAPYKEYLNTLSLWRRIIAYLLLYIFIHPAASLVLQGSSTRKGVIEKMRDRLVELSNDTKKCRGLITSLFSVLGDTLYENAQCAKSFSGEKTFAIFREEELAKRIKEHGYDHAKVLAGFNTWLMEMAAVKSDIPLIGPFIDSIINSNLASALVQQDYISQILSLINSPSNTHNSPVAYKLLQSIAYLLKEAHDELKRKYDHSPSGPDVNQKVEATFNPTELKSHESQVDHIPDLAYASASSPQEIADIHQRRLHQLDDVNTAIWPSLLSSIKVVTRDGAALLLSLMVDPERTSHIRIGVMEKIQELLTQPLGEIEPSAYTDVHGLVSANAMSVIKMALEHEFSEESIKERAHYAYKYASILITTMQEEMSLVISELFASSKRAYEVQGSHLWQDQIAQSINIVMKGIAILKTRLALLKNVPAEPPFTNDFLKKIATTMHAQAEVFAQSLEALKILSTKHVPFITKLMATCAKTHALLASHAKSNALAPPFADLNKRTLLNLQGELSCYIEENTLHQIYQELEKIDNAQAAIKQALQREAFLQEAEQALTSCLEIVERAAAFGDETIIKDLWSVNYDKEALLQRITNFIDSGKLIEHPYIEELRNSASIHHLNNTLYLYLTMLAKERARELSFLPPKDSELKRRLAPCAVRYSSDYKSLSRKLIEAKASEKALITAQSEAIAASRGALFKLYSFVDTTLRSLCESACDELKVVENLKTKYTELQASMQTLEAPQLPLVVEWTDVLAWPLVSLLGYSREGIKKQVDPMAQRQVCLGRDFLHKPEVLAHITRRFMVNFFCENPPK